MHSTEHDDKVALFLTTGRVGQLLGVSKPTVRKLAQSGELPHRIILGEYRFHREDVDRFIERLHEAQRSAK
jgi:excisionase family DNA binding protein